MLKNANEISQEVFGGKISPWQILDYARKGTFPYVTVGRRKFFDTDDVMRKIRSTSVK